MCNEMRRILVIRTGAIGDCILTFPVLSVLQHAYPTAAIDVMGSPSILDLATHGGYARECISIDRGDVAPFFANRAVLPETMVETFARYDLVVSYLPDPDGVFAHNLSRSRVRSLLTGSPKPEPGERLHATHHLLRAIHPLGVIGDEASPPVYQPSDDDRQRANACLRALGVDPASQVLAAIHPGSGGRRKCWPVDRYAAVIDALDIRGYRVLVSAGPADADVIEALRRRLVAAKPLILDHPTLPVLAGVFTRCRFMIGNDSGITHLATATGIPTMALFGPTDPAVWGPRGERVRIHWGEHTIAGDVGKPGIRTPEPALPDLTTITVARVLKTVEEIVKIGESANRRNSRK